MAVVDGDDPKEYRWETGYEKTWEVLREDDDGLLDGVISDIIQKAKRKRQLERSHKNRLGMMRHLFLVLDTSEAMMVPDLKPTRMICTLKLLEIFIKEFFGQNPLSQLGLIILKGKRAEKMVDLMGNDKLLLKALERLQKMPLFGEPSLQNGIDLALNALKVVPSHASREILILMSSLTTCDPCDINKSIEALKQEKIRCSVITLSAEIHVCRHLTEVTNGAFGAVVDDAHYRDQLLDHINPPGSAQKFDNALIKMGFPHSKTDEGKDPPLSMCMCHLESTEEASKLSSAGYYCPQCKSKYCELPVECLICSLTLVSAPHLARSYHHLFPVPSFTEITNEGKFSNCFGCEKDLTDKTVDRHIFQCETCRKMYCIDCDIFIHDTLFTCVGCNTIPSIAIEIQARKPQPAATITSTISEAASSGSGREKP